jgi:acetyl-CoA carboxylase biotin carboxylase subunit
MRKRGRDINALRAEADNIGYPVLIKASAGGGGKGMRVVHSSTDLPAAVEAGMREAKSAFGDDSIYLEKYMEEPRHIEFQILADTFGNTVHLFERECSIQRRYQKIVEETPSMALDENLRQRMGDAAVQVARSCGYTNAGTVEFLLDKDRNFYFLEVNARLQVEHPITELVTGVDLVRQQILIASGEKLEINRGDLSQRGHAIECRIYAEDPENDFLPSLGNLLFVKEPMGPGIRNDSWIYSGLEVTMHYDPLLAKLIAWGEDRHQARKRMVCALSDYAILGIQTQIPFLTSLMEHPGFVAGRTTTDFIPAHMSHWKEERGDNRFEDQALIAAAIASVNRHGLVKQQAQNRHVSPWTTVGKWEIGAAT